MFTPMKNYCKNNVQSISLDDIRRGGPKQVTTKLKRLTGGQMCVVNAVSYRDLEVLTRGLLTAEAAGRQFLYRTASSFVRVRAGLGPRPLLPPTELKLPAEGAGLIAEAEAAVRACKYPPEGIRGVAGSPRAAGYGQQSKDYLTRANDEILIITAVETPEAVANLDDILTVDGLDGIFIGPMDLATSMGHRFNPGHPAVKETIAQIEAKVLTAGKFLGTVAGNWEQAQERYERGYQLLMLMSDTVSLGALAAKTAAQFHEAYPER